MPLKALKRQQAIIVSVSMQVLESNLQSAIKRCSGDSKDLSPQPRLIANMFDNCFEMSKLRHLSPRYPR